MKAEVRTRRRRGLSYKSTHGASRVQASSFRLPTLSFNLLSPILRPNLRILFVGFNPHPYSWERGKYYAHGSLWRILRKSGLGEIYDDSQLLDLGYGITDLVPDRPTREAHEVADEEYRQGAERLRGELTALRPQVVCFTGKGAYAHFAGVRTGKVAYGEVGVFGSST